MFDILPLYGVLRPHSSHQISVTFYGHCDIIAQAKALCEVEGGPTYEILLRGEASLVNYSSESWDRVPHRASSIEPASPCLCLCLSLSLWVSHE